MTKKVAVAILHGIGTQRRDSAKKKRDNMNRMAEKLQAKFSEALPERASDLVIEPIYWGEVLEDQQQKIWNSLRDGEDMIGHYISRIARHFLISSLGDATAYQRARVDIEKQEDPERYDLIHAEVAKGLRKLAERAGKDAPLCIVAHSLGTIISSNYIYDLQCLYDREDGSKNIIPYEVHKQMGDTSLERGETLCRLYTLGSPLLLWTLRWPDFSNPIRVPAQRLSENYPGMNGEWVNFYDPYDMIGFPLRVHAAYKDNDAVNEDKPVVVRHGFRMRMLGLMAHNYYWGDKQVINPIAEGLVQTWKEANGAE